LSHYKKLFDFIRPYTVEALLAPLFMLVEVSMDLMQPHLLQSMIDSGVARGRLDTVAHVGATMAVCALMGMFGGVGCTVFTARASARVGADIRSKLFRKTQDFSFANLDQFQTGSLITRLTNDVSQIQVLIQMGLRFLVRTGFMLTGSLIMAVATSPKLSLLYVLLIPLVCAVIGTIMKVTHPLFGEAQKRLDDVNVVLQENLAGVRVVKAFARAGFEIARFGSANTRLTDQNILIARLTTLTFPCMFIVVNSGVAAVLWLGGSDVIHGFMPVGHVIAFVNYLMQTLFSLMMVSMLIVQIARAQASLDRVFEVIDSSPSIVYPKTSAPATISGGDVEFENVSFRYGSDDERLVLKNISFKAEPGQTVAILGETGSGKSTLVHLLARFYDVTSGSIKIDGVDVRNYSEDDLHSKIATSLQEAVLFSGTIRENIRYGCPSASDDRIEEVARLAQAEEFIQNLPNKFDEDLGQNGVNLSGGQRQRLALARAFISESEVLVLDDSTSAVDMRTEAKINEALLERKGTRTTFIIAQRISSIINADKILVLDKGEICAQGVHEDLLDSCQPYREIYESQMSNKVLDHAG
jgi:ATP-binding cassette subfamily B protein